MKSMETKRNVLWAGIFILTLICLFWFWDANKPVQQTRASKPSIETAKATPKQPVALSNAASNVLGNQVSVATNVTAAAFSSGTNTTTNLLAKTAGQISANALKQIGALEAEKSRRTPIQQKIDSQLLYADKMQRGEPVAEGIATQRVNLDRDRQGRVLVDIKADVTQSLLQFITALGGNVINNFPEYRAIQAGIPLSKMENLAAQKEVAFIQPVVHSMRNSVDSEGDYTHQANTARVTFGVNGTGVKVGVISDSVDYLSGSQIDGVVTVLPGQSGMPDTGEGTAMLEIVNDLAPGAQLYFATRGTSDAQFASNIQTLRSTYGCDIIVDDILYHNESPFQDGIIAQAVNTVTASGALYFSSASNAGNQDSGTSGTWEGNFVDSGDTNDSTLPANSGHVHSFGSAIYNTVLGTGPGGPELRVDLFWADPLGASTNDYDVYVLDSTLSYVVAYSTGSQTGTQNPYEHVDTLSSGENIVIVKFSGAGRFLNLSTGRGELAISTQGSTRGHNCATNAFCVAATDANNSYPYYPYSFTGGSANPVESDSSDGPRRVFFQANGTPITPGNFSSSGGAVRQKPDITAADGVTTDLPYGGGLNPFYGTSAAAPHAAAIAALLKSSSPSLTPAQIRTILTGTALDIMGTGTDRDSGAGIVMAMSALQAAPHPDLTKRTDSLSNTSPHAGDVVTASLAITNKACSGGSANAGAFQVGFYFSSDSSFNGVSPFYEASVSGCVAKAGVDLNQNITIDPAITPGTYYLGYKINDENEVSECNEDNNGIFYWTVTVLPPSQPDLTRQTDSLSNSSPHPRDRVTATITITNQSCSDGSAIAGAFHAGFYWSTNSSFSGVSPFKEASVGGCTANGTVSLTNNFTISDGTVPGTYYFGYKIDDENEVAECNDGNNGIFYWTVTVIPDTTNPTNTITAPISGQRWSNAVFTVTGTAGDNVQVSNVWCQINGQGWNLASTGNNWSNWTAQATLTPGTNTITAYAVDTSGNYSLTNSVSLQYVVTSQIQILTSGWGTVAPYVDGDWLEIGRNYSLTATPGTGCGFVNWTGSLASSATTLNFTMASNLTLQANFLDVTKPTLTITVPTAGQKMTNALVTGIGTASDNWQISNVWYQLNNGAWSLGTTTNSFTNWTTPTLTLFAGTNLLKAYALDLGGNYSLTNSVSFVSSNTFLLQLAFTNALPMKTNGLVFNLQLSTGLNGQIQVSTNLTSWATLTNFVGSNSNITFRDPAATNSSQRFYRAVIP